MTKAEYPVAEQQSREPPLTTELPAFVMREPWLDRKMRMWLTMLMVDTPTAIGFAFTWLWFSGSILMVSALSGRILPVFDTPMERWISNGSVLHCALRVARLRVLV
ncbi:hypothetical protein GA663_08415 [Bifidobacterium adolescentis]|nr:hypothetical protein GA663_08415 [Bifidobacterium adolescentis]KAB5893326.1 hypothetical protein GA619_02820 [Bifidobacterium adolescentis]KAB5906651.1 hypothetical protein GA616_08060 [Bifidobacterium adolescentis]